MDFITNTHGNTVPHDGGRGFCGAQAGRENPNMPSLRKLDIQRIDFRQTFCDRARVTRKPEVIGSSVGVRETRLCSRNLPASNLGR
jgi:hypothetical protein